MSSRRSGTSQKEDHQQIADEQREPLLDQEAQDIESNQMAPEDHNENQYQQYSEPFFTEAQQQVTPGGQQNNFFRGSDAFKTEEEALAEPLVPEKHEIEEEEEKAAAPSKGYNLELRTFDQIEETAVDDDTDESAGKKSPIDPITQLIT